MNKKFQFASETKKAAYHSKRKAEMALRTQDLIKRLREAVATDPEGENGIYQEMLNQRTQG